MCVGGGFLQWREPHPLDANEAEPPVQWKIHLASNERASGFLCITIIATICIHISGILGAGRQHDRSSVIGGHSRHLSGRHRFFLILFPAGIWVHPSGYRSLRSRPGSVPNFSSTRKILFKILSKYINVFKNYSFLIEPLESGETISVPMGSCSPERDLLERDHIR